ncbi:MAG: hypothetical protein VX265_12500 [Myxococcota bacterium]|nr:hypothetical protein [Myxococcota bacterium]
MVAALLATLLAAAPAAAASTSVAPYVALVGADSVRPGLRFGYEPLPAASIDLQGDVSTDGDVTAGLALTGRGFFGGRDDATGLFMLGRLGVGVASEADLIGPWVGLFGGFGARPMPGLEIAVSTGPDWATEAGGRWRTELTVGWVIGKGTFKPKPGSGMIRHRPRPVPDGSVP